MTQPPEPMPQDAAEVLRRWAYYRAIAFYTGAFTTTEDPAEGARAALAVLDELERLQREVNRLHTEPPYCTCDESDDGWTRCHGVQTDARVGELRQRVVELEAALALAQEDCEGCLNGQGISVRAATHDDQGVPLCESCFEDCCEVGDYSDDD